MKRLLQQTCAKVSKRKRKRLTPREYDALQQHYPNILTRGERELPPIPAKHNGKRGRVAKSDAHNLWERLKEHERAVLLFAQDPNVPFSRVSDWRGKHALRGVAVVRQSRCLNPCSMSRFQSLLVGRVEDWRAGLGRSLCSL